MVVYFHWFFRVEEDTDVLNEHAVANPEQIVEMVHMSVSLSDSFWSGFLANLPIHY